MQLQVVIWASHLMEQEKLFNDDVKARFGDENDLEIYHDANESFKDSAGAGDLSFGVADIVADTTPQLGGDGAVDLNDDDIYNIY